jgi:hypothetical protein
MRPIHRKIQYPVIRGTLVNSLAIKPDTDSGHFKFQTTCQFPLLSSHKIDGLEFKAT